MSRGDRSRPGRERNAQERERDRQERARRRALRAGDADAGERAAGLGDEPPGEGAPATDLPMIDESALPAPGAPALEDADGAAAPGSPLESEPPLPLDSVGRGPAARGSPLESESSLPLDSVGRGPAAPDDQVLASPGANVQPPGAAAEQPEQSAVARPDAVAEPWPLVDAGPEEPPLAHGQPQAPAPVPPPPPPSAPARPPAPERPGSAAPSRRRSRSPIARLAALLALAAVVAAVLLLFHSLRSKSATRVAAPVVVKVVIPEGKTRPQIAEIATAAGLTGSYRAASKRSTLLNPAHYGAPRGTPYLEGFLFPATYDMDRGGAVSRLVQEQLIAFRENFGAREIARARSLHLTPYDLLIVASMVEREAQVPGDRSKIAAVIYNRLREGMPLGIDATIYYAVELAKGIPTYTHELSESQLHIDSAYNTRTHAGLPPTPISNPGLASIHAAAYPAHVSYLYYVAGADGCGEQVFSNTLAEFEVHSAAYKAAVEKNGGHPPTCKHR